jgi:hypothetical protein
MSLKIWKKEEIKMKFTYEEALQIQKELSKLKIEDDSILTQGAQRHSEKSPSSEASADRWGMRAKPRTVANYSITS